MAAALERLDFAGLPDHAFGHRSTLWWGTVGFVAIETTAFALWWGSLNTTLLLASAWPNQLAKRAAEAQDLRRVRLWLLVCLASGLLFLAIRALELTTLDVRWDSNAHGSVVWLIIGLHTTHRLTEVADTAVLAALMLTRHGHGRRFVDVNENAFYWHFLVLTWLPLYAIIYGGPRLG